MSDRKVFRKDCKNYRPVVRQGMVYVRDACLVASITLDPIRGEARSVSDAAERNANFDCEHFTPHGAERIAPGKAVAPEPKSPWWKF